MIVIRVEMWPQGNHENARDLAYAVIANDGTGTADAGNYRASFSPQLNIPITPAQLPPGISQKAKVTGFPRAKRNVWQLIQQALNAALRQWRVPWVLNAPPEGESERDQ